MLPTANHLRTLITVVVHSAILIIIILRLYRLKESQTLCTCKCTAETQNLTLRIVCLTVVETVSLPPPGVHGHGDCGQTGARE